MKRATLLITALLAGGAVGATATGATGPPPGAQTQQGKKGSTAKPHRRARHRGRCLRKRHHRCVARAHPAPHRHSTSTSSPNSGPGAGGGSGSGGTSTGGAGAGGSGGSGVGGTTGTTTAPGTSTTTTTPPPPPPSRTAVDVNDNGPPTQPYSMYPAHTQLAAGKVQFNVDNFGQDPHTFVIEDSTQTVVADANGSTDPANLPAGSSGGASSTTVNYNLPAGTYTMLCTLSDHANKGMKFTFTVG